jgi:hypothetical protein
MLLSTIRQATYTRQINQPLNFFTASSLTKIGIVIQRYASQALTILTTTQRNVFYYRSAEILIKILQQLSLTKTLQLPPAPFVPPLPPVTYPLSVHIVDLFGMNAPDLTVKIWRISDGALMATLKTDKNGLTEPVKLPAGQYSIEIYKDEKLQLQQIITLNKDTTLEIQIGIPVAIPFSIIAMAIIAATLILTLIYITKRRKR